MMGQAILTSGRMTPAELVTELNPRTSETMYVGGWTPLGRAVFSYRDRQFHCLPLSDGAAARGYAWGQTGSAAREVARAILLDATGNEMLAERLCRPYTWKVISRLQPGGFVLARSKVLEWIESWPRPVL